jgi:ATP-binding cassette subfamily F protein 3
MELKAARLERQRTVSQQQDVYIAKTEEFIRRYKNSSRRAQAIGRERRLKRFVNGYTGPGMIFIKPRVEAPERQRQLRFALDQPERSGDLVLRFEDLVIGYDQDQPLLCCPDLEIYRGARIAIIGPNGSGKTTMLRTMIGQIAPLAGRVVPGHGVQLTYVQQTQERCGGVMTVLESIRAADPQIGEQEARTLLGRFLFTRDTVYKPVDDLSGGEWTRLELARLTLSRGNLMVLDEPTNHLDIGARQALEEALDRYTGTLLIVSHDRAFIDAVADLLWIVRDGELRIFEGSYSQYIARGDV